MPLTAQINADVLKWAKDSLDPWQHEALRRILNRGSLSEQDFADLLQRAKFDLKLDVPEGTLPDLSLTADDLPTPTPSSDRLCLKALRNLENVNALESGQVLTFGTQLTVIYGENASGKSGYVRVLKAMARCPAKAVETILPDVYATPATSNPAKATLEFEVSDKPHSSGKPHSLEWQDGDPSPDVLQRFAVFDAKCGRAYLLSENEVAFVPTILESLKLLSDATDTIKMRLNGWAQKAAPPSTPAYQFMVEDRTSVGKALARLSVQTRPETISSLGGWTDLHTQTLLDQSAELERLSKDSPQTLRDRLNRDKRDLTTIQDSLTTTSSTLADSKIADLKGYATKLTQCSQAYDAAVQLALGGSRIKGVGSEAWASLIKAAAKFSTTEAYKGQPFPPTAEDAVCVLCQRPLDEESATRLKRFWDFLQAEAATQRDTAKIKLDNAASAMRVVSESLPETVRVLAPDFQKNRPAFWQEVLSFFRSARSRLAAVEKALAGGNWDEILHLDERAIPNCAGLLSNLEKEILQVEDDAQFQAKIEKLRKEIAESQACKQLSENLPIVLNHLSALKLTQRIKTAADSLSTRTITEKVKDICSQYATKPFRESVGQHAKELGLCRTRFAIGAKPEKGKILHSITLDGARMPVSPDGVLSEGERTAVSLSYFLADLGTPEDTWGMIFDDPVTSLDHRIREGVVNILVSEAKQRQVIVFTHDLGLCCELLSAATVAQVDVHPQQVECFSNIVGQVSDTAPRETLKVTQRYAELEKMIKTADDADRGGKSSEFQTAVDRFYSLLRAAWERTVEELLFNKVVSRYQKEVKTQNLTGVVVDQESVAAVFQGMTRGSDRTEAHDHAPATALPKPTVAALNTHLQELKDFVSAQKTKISDSEKQNKHLKG